MAFIDDSELAAFQQWKSGGGAQPQQAAQQPAQSPPPGGNRGGGFAMRQAYAAYQNSMNDPTRNQPLAYMAPPPSGAAPPPAYVDPRRRADGDMSNMTDNQRAFYEQAKGQGLAPTWRQMDDGQGYFGIEGGGKEFDRRMVEASTRANTGMGLAEWQAAQQTAPVVTPSPAPPSAQSIAPQAPAPVAPAPTSAAPPAGAPPAPDASAPQQAAANSWSAARATAMQSATGVPPSPTPDQQAAQTAYNSSTDGQNSAASYRQMMASREQPPSPSGYQQPAQPAPAPSNATNENARASEASQAAGGYQGAQPSQQPSAGPWGALKASSLGRALSSGFRPSLPSPARRMPTPVAGGVGAPVDQNQQAQNARAGNDRMKQRALMGALGNAKPTAYEQWNQG